MIKGVMELLKRTHDEVTEQVRLNKRCQFNLEKDLADKFQGYATVRMFLMILNEDNDAL